jgi:hypothetical protein
MTNHTYSYFQELIDLTGEILTKMTRVREIIEEGDIHLQPLDRPAEHLYKEVLNFKYKVHEVSINGKDLS